MRYHSKNNIVKGFTLIELLIVIAVLGILAIAVLSAINPIEQINRSRDTGSRSDAEQLIGAIDRFYATNGYYPWQTAVGTAGAALSFRPVDTVWTVPSTAGSKMVLDLLSEAGTEEIKKSFVNRIVAKNYNRLYVYNKGGVGESFYICFLPQSGAFRTEAANRCSQGLPVDLQPVSSTICNTGAYYSCLP